jgi:hypothetical protein
MRRGVMNCTDCPPPPAAAQLFDFYFRPFHGAFSMFSWIRDDADPTARAGDTCLHPIARRGYWHLGRFVLMQVVVNNPEARRAAANQKNAAGQ